LHQFAFRLVSAKIDHTLAHGAFLAAVIGDAGGVRKKLADGDVLPGLGRLGNVLCHSVVELELPFFHKHHDGHGSELLADRARLEDGFRGHRDIQLTLASP
jgi:hypothetical protein